MSERVQGQFFSSRWGLMLAMLGMAVGTGNIWRFPRIAASNGGGSFLIAWVVFLFLWSIPLILLEFSMGKGLRKGPVGAMAHFLGDKLAWMGVWIGWTAAAIGFYYAVVMGWTIRYFGAAITGSLGAGESQQLWDSFSFTPAALIFHALAVIMAMSVVAGGVKGIERVARVLMPMLVVLVVILAARAVTLPGATAGLSFLFTPDFAVLGNYRVWLEALTQNAWDTGAGWGLVICYAVYSRRNEDTNLNGVLLAFGNNSISLMSGILVMCTIFSVVPAAQAAAELQGATNEGLTFVWIPELFNSIPGGSFFMVLFFMALVVAAWTSLVSLFELIARVTSELGFERKKVMPVVGVAVWLLGIPSALSQKIFSNQDFVWSVSLMLSGLFFAGAVLKYGVTRYRNEFINTEHQDLRIGAWWDWAIRLVAVQAVILIGWWFWQIRSTDPFAPDGLATMLIEWGIVLAVLLAFNRWIASRAKAARTAEVDS